MHAFHRAAAANRIDSRRVDDRFRLDTAAAKGRDWNRSAPWRSSVNPSARCDSTLSCSATTTRLARSAARQRANRSRLAVQGAPQDLLALAAITNGPQSQAAAASHDLAAISIKSKHDDASVQSRWRLGKKCTVFDAKDQLYFEHDCCVASRQFPTTRSDARLSHACCRFQQASRARCQRTRALPLGCLSAATPGTQSHGER